MPGVGVEPTLPRRAADFKSACVYQLRHPGGQGDRTRDAWEIATGAGGGVWAAQTPEKRVEATF